MARPRNTGHSGFCPAHLSPVFVAFLCVFAAFPAIATVDEPAPDSPPSSPPTDMRFRSDRWLWQTEELVPETKLPPIRAIYGSPFDWSPDGAVLLFAERRDDGGRLVAISLRTLRKYTLAETPRPITSARWSSDSACIAYVTLSEPTDEHRLVVIRLASGHKVEVAEGLALLSRIEWSPDSRRLAAIISGPRGRGLAVWELDGQRARQLCWVPGASIYWHDPVWSPDGDRILVRDPAADPVIVDVTSGEPATHLGPGLRAVSASPDLRYLVVVSDGHALVVEVPTGEKRTILLHGQPAVLDEPYLQTGPAWFGDSSACALSQDGRLWVVDPITGQGKPVGPQQVPGYPRLERSGPAGAIAYHQGTNEAELNGLHILSHPGGQPRRILDSATSGGIATIGHGWRWSPNGKWGTYRVSSCVDPRDPSLGQYVWDLLLSVRTGKLYHLPHQGWTPYRRMRRLFWSPTHSQALVWFDDGPRLLTLPD